MVGSTESRLVTVVIKPHTRYKYKIHHSNVSLVSPLNSWQGRERLTKCSLVLESETFFWPWDVIVMGTWQSLRDSLSVKRSLSLVIWLSLQLYQKAAGSQQFTINISVLGEELFLLLLFSSQLSRPLSPSQFSTSRTWQPSLGTAALGRKSVRWRRLRCDQWLLVADWMMNFPSEMGRRLSRRGEGEWGDSQSRWS